jgi:phosphatidylglycerol:prolipoprotein diacylglycerol transferase
MSFHGGVLWVLIALAVYAKKYSISYLKVTDGITSILPLGIWLGRIWNYVNNELPGYINYTGPFAMNIQGMPHFPSPLLESLLEGWITGIILYFVVKWSPRPWITSCIFLICYTLARCTSEFFRLPDAHIGYIIPWISLGMILTIPLWIFWIIYWAILLQWNTPSSSSSWAS